MSFINQALSFFSVGPVRSFAGITGYITISENTSDTLTLTKQPIQSGAMVTDHAFKNPVAFSMSIQFSNSSSLTNGFGLFGGDSLNAIYANLQALQAPIPPAVLAPFSVVTPKRTYSNMMLTSLGCTTDKKTENVLSIQCGFEEVIIVPISSTVVPATQLTNPGNNLGTQNVGKKSALASFATGFGAL